MQTLSRLLAALFILASIAACGGEDAAPVEKTRALGPLEALRHPALVPQYDQAFWADAAKNNEALLRTGARYCADSVWTDAEAERLHPNCRAVAVPINALNSRQAREEQETHSFSADSFTFK